MIFSTQFHENQKKNEYMKKWNEYENEWMKMKWKKMKNEPWI